MSETAKIVPESIDDPTYAPYWQATTREEVVIQKCSPCGHLRWPPQGTCPECLSLEWTWSKIRPTGTLLSYVVYYRAFDAAFADQIPYTVGLVQLDDGPRMYGIVRDEVADGDIDGPVHAIFEPVIEGAAFVRWRLGAA